MKDIPSSNFNLTHAEFESNKTERIKALCSAYSSAVTLFLQSPVQNYSLAYEKTDKDRLISEIESVLRSSFPIYLPSNDQQ